jgi:hypothetical protein
MGEFFWDQKKLRYLWEDNTWEEWIEISLYENYLQNCCSLFLVLIHIYYMQV